MSDSGSIYLLLVLLLALTGCEKEATQLPFPEVPQIRLIEVSRTEVKEFTDTLEILLHYQDGDGDLGQWDPDLPSLVVKDARLGKADSFHLQPLAPPGARVPLEGELRVRLPPLFLLGNGSSETTRFRIKLLDRAGHESNEVQTPNIRIIR
jgi:hypothetical protein